MALAQPNLPDITTTSTRQRKSRRVGSQTAIAYAFLAPSLILFLIFRHGPAVFSLILSMFNWTMVDDPEFVGTRNFEQLAQDEIFWKALWNTVKYTIFAVPPDIILALLLAVLLNQQLRGMKFFRLAYFIPVVTSGALVAIVWRWLYQPRGILNGFLADFGLTPQRWLTDLDLVLPSIAVMAIWKHVGFNMLILLAGLQSIPPELEEAARLDGAGRMRIFFNITLPLLKPVLVLATILTTIGSFQMFDAAFVMTGGGPYYGSTTLVYYTYLKAFDQYQMGYGATIAFVLFLIILVVTLIQRRVLKGDEDVY
ncbi:MAG: sugar ABC transporter permease [Thermomicrobiales bacterium]